MNQLIQASGESRQAVTMSSREISRVPMGMIYIVEFSDGWIKVGRGKNADVRIRQHETTSRMRDARLIRAYKSERIVNPAFVEREMIAYCRSAGECVFGNEWFTGVPFDDLVNAAKRSEKFVADNADAAGALTSKACSKEAEESFAAMFYKPDAEARAWLQTQAHARTLEHIYLNDGFGGEAFQETGKGYSKFFLFASIAIHGMTPSEVAAVYVDAVEVPTECLDLLIAMASDAASKYRKEAA